MQLMLHPTDSIVQKKHTVSDNDGMWGVPETLLDQSTGGLDILLNPENSISNHSYPGVTL